MGFWLAIGVGIGSAFGAAMGNMGLWLALGAGIGATLGVAKEAALKRKQ